MSFQDAKDDLASILNRRDLTDSQSGIFLKKGMRRIQREVRCPAMESLLTWTCDGSPYIAIPSNYLELISLSTQDTQGYNKLVRKDLQTVLRQSQFPGYPSYFYRQANQFVMGPNPPIGTKVYVNYYQDALALTGNADENWMTLSAPDLLTYAALTRAADFYLDERKTLFENTYQEIAQSLNNMATQDELESASIAPAYSTDFW